VPVISVRPVEATWHADRMPNRNVLSVQVRPSHRTGTDEVDVMVDGVHLYELLGLRRAEWIAPPRSVLCPPSDHLFGGPDRWENPSGPSFKDGRVAVAACRCGQPGCAAVLMRVTVRDDEIVWSEFETHLAGDRIDREFHFNPKQYAAVVRTLCR
jgi:hypothetical protein